MKRLKTWLENNYGKGTEMTVTCGEEQITGTMYGNDECWEMNKFYQFLLTENAIYKAYLYVPDYCGELNSIDYKNPYDLLLLKNINAQYYIDYII